MWYRAAIWNPYEEKIKDLQQGKKRRDSQHGWDISHDSRDFEAEERLVKEYAYGIPNEEAIKAIIELGKIAEVGAGGGYWKAVGDKAIQDGEIIVPDYDDKDFWLAYDKNAGNINSIWRPDRKWSRVHPGDSEVLSKHPDRAALFVWPPHDDPMAFEGLRTHNEAGGDNVAYVGEGRGGCTGDDKFHDLLRGDYDLVNDIEIPHRSGIHDRLYLYNRK